MTTFLEIADKDFFPSIPTLDSKDYDRRASVRAVVLNEQRAVALLRLNALHSHKLPGGGIEEGENMYRAIEREIAEEIGCVAHIEFEIGRVVEYRNRSHLTQESYAFVMRQYGVIGTPSHSARERSQRCEAVWVSGIDEALELVQSDSTSDYTGQFIRQRDLAILMAAKRFIC